MILIATSMNRSARGSIFRFRRGLREVSRILAYVAAGIVRPPRSLPCPLKLGASMSPAGGAACVLEKCKGLVCCSPLRQETPELRILWLTKGGRPCTDENG